MKDPDILIKVKRPNGTVEWKQDSFWTIDGDKYNAKMHSMSGIDYLIKSLMGTLNSTLNTRKPNSEKFILAWDGREIGVDYIYRYPEGYKYDFLKNGQYKYRITYNDKEAIFELVDICRKTKLEKLEKLN